MSALKLVITILQLLCGLAIIVAVLFQSGKSAGLSGAIGGVADSFLAKVMKLNDKQVILYVQTVGQ